MDIMNQTMDKNQRPRTKRLERPTPNLTHPVINDKKSNENCLQLEECIQVMNKCQITSSTNNSNKLKVKYNSISKQNNSQTIKQRISELKLNCHHFNDSIKSIKSSVLRNKSEEKFEFKKNNLQETIDSNSVQKTNQDLKLDNDINSIMESNNSEKITEESDWSGWQQFNAQLIPCSHCCRTFFPHRLPVHEKCCKGIKKTNNRSKPKLITTRIMKCVSLECTTCGRKYRTTSLTSHQLKCKTNNFRKRLNTEKIETQNGLRSGLRADNESNKKSFSDRLEENKRIL